MYLNQLNDGRVLFFATREHGGNGSAEFQARMWNPDSNAAEILKVSAESKRDADIAVLSDGRVLIVNGIEGSADLWDSHTNIVAHTEEPMLVNSRWRALPLDGGQILLIETFSDGFAATVRSVEHSVVLLWNPADVEWQRISNLPVPFKNSDILIEMDDGSVHAKADGNVYRLPAGGKDWESWSVPIQPSREQASVPAIVQSLSASENPVVLPKLTVPALPAAERSWWEVQREQWQERIDNNIAYIFLLAALSPVGLYFILRRLEAKKLATFLKFSSLAFRVLGICLVAFILWGSLKMNSQIKMSSYWSACADETRDGGYPVPLNRAQKWASCIDGKNGLIEDIFFYSTKKLVMSLPSVPCQYIGTWSSIRPGSKYKVTMTDDSRFIAEPMQTNSGTADTISGSWGVVGEEMVWLYQEGPVWPPDVNRILPKSRSRFTLIETNGTRTDYELIDAIKSNHCLLSS